MMLTGYRLLTSAAAPLARLFLRRRRRRGREDTKRFTERFGIASTPRPDGPLILIHAASVGEANSALCLIERLRQDYPQVSILMTTGTVTSAAIMASRLPPGVIHQYVPVDNPRWVRRFLDHWRPGVALWMESEFWPNLLGGLSVRGVKVILVNARISAASLKGWQRFPRTIARLLGYFSLCLAQSDGDGDKLTALGATTVRSLGNLKFAAAPLPVNDGALAAMRDGISERPIWVAASTHPGEEEIIADAHRLVAKSHPQLLTIIVPRHPVRGAAIEQELRLSGITTARRAIDGPIAPGTQIYVADTVGELGLFYRLAQIAFIGGTLIPHGGQNLLEPARLGCAILHGPSMTNFAAISEEMENAAATECVNDAQTLATAIDRLLSDPALLDQRVAAAASVASAKKQILDDMVAAIAPFIENLIVAESAAVKDGQDHEGA
jgi:3-deoxy-D-manno-octulosonic-acid transferase